MPKKVSVKPMKRNGSVPMGGLANDPQLLLQYVQMSCESAGDGSEEDCAVTEEVIEVAKEYDAALWSALEALVKKHPPKGNATAEDLWDAEAPYLVLMTLRGEGVGIWDGRWDEFYKDTDDAEKFLKSRLKEFATDGSSGKLEEAFMNAAYETAGGDEEDDEDDEDDDDEE